MSVCVPPDIPPNPSIRNALDLMLSNSDASKRFLGDTLQKVWTFKNKNYTKHKLISLSLHKILQMYGDVTICFNRYSFYYRTGPCYRIRHFLSNCVRFTRNICDEWQQRTLTPPDPWFCPILGLLCGLMLRSISPKLVLFPDFRVSNTPRYFYFTFYKKWVLLLCNLRNNYALELVYTN